MGAMVPPPPPASSSRHPLLLLPCGYCDQIFTDHPDLILHVETVHPAEGDDDEDEQQQEGQEDEEGGEEHHQCEPCGETFPTEAELQRHISGYHHSALKAPWRCQVCSKTFPYRTRLVHHAETHKRIEERERRFGCDDCDKRFLRSGDLWAHRRIHSGETYPCGTCGKRLSSSGAFHNHMRTHSEERLFACRVCERDDFATRQKMEVHEMRHDGGRRPFRCVLTGCEERKVGFVHKQSLEAHVRRCHGGTAIKCGVCGKLFSDRAYLNRHLRWHGTVKKKKVVVVQT